MSTEDDHMTSPLDVINKKIDTANGDRLTSSMMDIPNIPDEQAMKVALENLEMPDHMPCLGNLDDFDKKINQTPLNVESFKRTSTYEPNFPSDNDSQLDAAEISSLIIDILDKTECDIQINESFEPDEPEISTIPTSPAIAIESAPETQDIAIDKPVDSPAQIPFEETIESSKQDSIQTLTEKPKDTLNETKIETPKDTLEQSSPRKTPKDTTQELSQTDLPKDKSDDTTLGDTIKSQIRTHTHVSIETTPEATSKTPIGATSTSSANDNGKDASGKTEDNKMQDSEVKNRFKKQLEEDANISISVRRSGRRSIKPDTYKADDIRAQVSKEKLPSDDTNESKEQTPDKVIKKDVKSSRSTKKQPELPKISLKRRQSKLVESENSVKAEEVAPSPAKKPARGRSVASNIPKTAHKIPPKSESLLAASDRRSLPSSSILQSRSDQGSNDKPNKCHECDYATKNINLLILHRKSCTQKLADFKAEVDKYKLSLVKPKSTARKFFTSRQ